MASTSRHRSQFGFPRGFRGRLVGHFLALANAWMADVAIGAVRIGSDSQILEIGFGPGVAIRKLCERAPNGRVCGVDPSEPMLRQALRRNRAAAVRGQADLRLGDASSLPWPDATFDLILSLNNALLWDPIEGSIAECRRVLKPGGRLFIGLHVLLTRGGLTVQRDTLSRAEELLTRGLVAAGFVEISTVHHPLRIGTAMFLTAARP